MTKTTLLTLAAALAASAVLCESSRAAVHSRPDGSNVLEQRIESLGPAAWAALEKASPTSPELLARAWGNGGGRAWGNGGRAWGNGGGGAWGNGGRAFANGGGGGFANGYRGGFANW
ncbi:MAG: GrrA/OscA1 family cyclophane-containing rSAM-modified RiPP [Synechococcus sp.]|nr:GrrA/OscA1 family cyclophane-containing rSAM-modified RiPP [Synechococcus sp.]